MAPPFFLSVRSSSYCSRPNISTKTSSKQLIMTEMRYISVFNTSSDVQLYAGETWAHPSLFLPMLMSFESCVFDRLFHLCFSSSSLCSFILVFQALICTDAAATKVLHLGLQIWTRLLLPPSAARRHRRMQKQRGSEREKAILTVFHVYCFHSEESSCQQKTNASPQRRS